MKHLTGFGGTNTLVCVRIATVLRMFAPIQVFIIRDEPSNNLALPP